ncbi:MAG TPA: hypothetical protein VMW76_07345 [Bacteroidales bacterium]|nr:hypothetical protein [Bacteroidales bacterium]
MHIRIHTVVVMWLLRKALFAAAVFALFSILCSQEPEINMVPFKIARGSYIRLYDSLYYFSHDTILFLPGSMLPENPESVTRTNVFYDSLRLKASRSKLTKKLYDLVIVPPGRDNENKINNPNTATYARHSGKIIRQISVTRLDAFGTSISDPEQSTSRESATFMNRTHIKTREFIIRNYLFFNTGDTISPLTLSENERIIRKLAFIDDARFIIIPVSDDEVDILVVTKDIYSLGMNISLDGLKAGQINIFEKNLGGFGHELTLAMPYDYYRDFPPGIGLNYRMNNISRSLIDAEFSYLNALGKTSYQANITRDFVTAITRYAGGVSISETFTTEDLDTLDTPKPLEFNYLDIWGGRSFMLNEVKVSKAIIALRYINNNVYRRPEITSTSYHSLQKYKLYLGSVALSRQKYYKTNLIYNYGRNEDIPYGGLFRITLGREFNEFDIRDYYGIEASFGKFINRFGYLYGRGQYSTFSRDSRNEQNMLNFKTTYISNLYGAGKYKMRYFVSLDYTRGYNRFDDEYLRVNDRYGVRGFRNDSIRANERLYCNIEAVSFSPVYFYGFRFVFFAFADLALIRGNSSVTVPNDLISELGIGLRLRNNNLIFNTLQIRLGYFPYPPPYSRLDYVDMTSEKLLKPSDFNAMNPQIYPYR